MANLGPSTPASTYAYLLQVSGGLTSSLTQLQDGAGNGLPLSVSTTYAKFTQPVMAAAGLDLRGTTDGNYCRLLADPTMAVALNLYAPKTDPGASGSYLQVVNRTTGNIYLGWGSGGATAHSALTQLDYASAGHTGFAGTAVANTFTLTQSFNIGVGLKDATGGGQTRLLQSTGQTASYDVVLPGTAPTASGQQLVITSVAGSVASAAWVASSGGGVTAHSALTQLDYASAGHTGFAGTAVANTFTQAQTFSNSAVCSSGVTLAASSGGTTRLRCQSSQTGVFDIAYPLAAPSAGQELVVSTYSAGVATLVWQTPVSTSVANTWSALQTFTAGIAIKDASGGGQVRLLNGASMTSNYDVIMPTAQPATTGQVLVVTTLAGTVATTSWQAQTGGSGPGLSTNNVWTGTNSYGAAVGISGAPLTLRTNTGQTGNLLELRDTGNVLRSAFDVNGYGFPLPATFLLAIGTPAATGTNLTNALVVPRSGQVVKAFAYAKSAPSGQSLIFDILKNGTSIWNVTTSNRLSIAASGNSGTQTLFDTTSVAEGDLLTVNIAQVGSASGAGQDITVELLLRTQNQ